MSELIENKERRTVDVIDDQRSALVDSRTDGQLRLTRDICNNEMGNIKSTVQHILCGYSNGLPQRNTIEIEENNHRNTANASNNSLNQPMPENAYNHNHNRANPTQRPTRTSTNNKITIATPESDDEFNSASDHEQSDCEQASNVEQYDDEGSDYEMEDREAGEEEMKWICTSQCGSDCDGNHYVSGSEGEQSDIEEDNGSYRSEHSEDELVYSEDESEQHECDSRCDHSEFEASDVEGDDGEGSYYEEEDAEASEEEIEWTCTSQCGSDCDGNHYVSGSEDESYNGDDDSEVDDEPEATSDNDPAHMDIPEPPPQMDITSKLLTNGLSHAHIEIKERPRPKPRQSHCVRSASNTDVMSELKNAIDARVRRSASLRETSHSQEQPTRKTSDPSEYMKKMDIGEREARKQQRRKRLRTLELKREQLLDELREGSEISTNQKLYVTSSIDT